MSYQPLYPTPRLFVAEEAGAGDHPLIEPSLFYDPPYERALEDDFAWHLVKYLSPISGLAYQEKVQTPCAHVWVDFVVALGDRRIGFECGEVDAAADDAADDEQARLRAALIVGSGAVEVLYRLRGRDLARHLHDVLMIVAHWDAALFSRRGHVNLRTLASTAALACRPDPAAAVARVTYPEAEVWEACEDDAFAWPTGTPDTLCIHRLDANRPAAWLRDYEQALAHFGIPDDAPRRPWARSA